jgi:hypothetical protein
MEKLEMQEILKRKIRDAGNFWIEKTEWINLRVWKNF